jgi:hypothetical protein
MFGPRWGGGRGQGLCLLRCMSGCGYVQLCVESVIEFQLCTGEGGGLGERGGACGPAGLHLAAVC